MFKRLGFYVQTIKQAFTAKIYASRPMSKPHGHGCKLVRFYAFSLSCNCNPNMVCFYQLMMQSKQANLSAKQRSSHTAI